MKLANSHLFPPQYTMCSCTPQQGLVCVPWQLIYYGPKNRRMQSGMTHDQNEMILAIIFKGVEVFHAFSVVYISVVKN